MTSEAHQIANELLELESRRRKQIPIAVFTVITIHVVLFVALLGTAGCKQSAESTLGTSAAEQMRNQEYEVAASRMQQTTTREVNASSAAADPAVITTPEVMTLSASLGSQRRMPTAPTSEVAQASSIVYVVKPGDNLGKIAKQHGTTPKALKEANNLKSDLISVGQKLKIGEFGLVKDRFAATAFRF
jgi:LysM repeat protein